MSTQSARKVYDQVIKSRALVERLIQWAVNRYAKELFNDMARAEEDTDNALDQVDYLQAATANARAELLVKEETELAVRASIAAELKAIGYDN